MSRSIKKNTVSHRECIQCPERHVTGKEYRRSCGGLLVTDATSIPEEGFHSWPRSVVKDPVLP